MCSCTSNKQLDEHGYPLFHMDSSANKTNPLLPQKRWKSVKNSKEVTVFLFPIKQIKVRLSSKKAPIRFNRCFSYSLPIYGIYPKASIILFLILFCDGAGLWWDRYTACPQFLYRTSFTVRSACNAIISPMSLTFSLEIGSANNSPSLRYLPF